MCGLTVNESRLQQHGRLTCRNPHAATERVRGSPIINEFYGFYSVKTGQPLPGNQTLPDRWIGRHLGSPDLTPCDPTGGCPGSARRGVGEGPHCCSTPHHRCTSVVTAQALHIFADGRMSLSHFRCAALLHHTAPPLHNVSISLPLRRTVAPHRTTAARPLSRPRPCISLLTAECLYLTSAAPHCCSTPHHRCTSVVTAQALHIFADGRMSLSHFRCAALLLHTAPPLHHNAPPLHNVSSSLPLRRTVAPHRTTAARPLSRPRPCISLLTAECLHLTSAAPHCCSTPHHRCTSLVTAQALHIFADGRMSPSHFRCAALLLHTAPPLHVRCHGPGPTYLC
ncbi:hypothetical protein J6590_085020 [Homalodisca vitripennis]|nr:hypothetical protein J6590_085020 [Homalodisca vitripennis]